MTPKKVGEIIGSVANRFGLSSSELRVAIMNAINTIEKKHFCRVCGGRITYENEYEYLLPLAEAELKEYPWYYLQMQTIPKERASRQATARVNIAKTCSKCSHAVNVASSSNKNMECFFMSLAFIDSVKNEITQEIPL